MTIKEYMQTIDSDYEEFEDAEIDIVVGCNLIEDISDEYDKFCDYIISNVNMVEGSNDTADFYGFIHEHEQELEVFELNHWVEDYSDDDGEWSYQWINEIHLFMAGYTSEDIYRELREVLEGAC